jgi:hypothetical protein
VKSYRTTQDELRRSGFTVPVRVCQLPEAGQAGLPGPEAGVPLLGTVDTGAGMSMIREDRIEECGLVQRGTTSLGTFQGRQSTVPTYPAHVRVQEEWENDLIIAAGSFEDEPGLEFLIGRDILQHAVLSWNGETGTAELGFS